MQHLELNTSPQLFVDDYLIADRYGLSRTMHQPRKYPGNPILRAETPAEGHAVNLYGTVMRSHGDGTFRMWYQGYAGGAYHGLYATSHDGVYWERPSLGRIAFAGSRDNNLIDTDMAVINIIEDPADPDPRRRYKCLYFGQLGQSTAARTCVAFSPDGVAWTPYSENPVLDGTSDTHTLLGWDERIDRYVAYIRPSLHADDGTVRVIGRSESEDFVHWSTPVPVLAPDEQDPPALEFYGMPVFKRAGVYFGLLWAYHAFVEEPAIRMEAETEVQLAVSRDGISWDRLGDRKPFIPRGMPGAFDARGLYTAKEPVAVGDELWFYYGGDSTFHSPGGQQAAYALGLAKLRMDGFVSLDADETTGWVVTEPFRFEGSRLSVNAEVHNGFVAAAVLDAEGHHLDGYHRVDSVLADGCAVDQPITWRERTSLRPLRGEVIRLKFYLRDARLYAFHIDGE